MSLNVCRLCLSDQNLSPIFDNTEYSAKLSAILFATTGLKISVDDGLPQKICNNCTELIDISLKLRHQARNSELHFLKMGFILTENKLNYQEIDITGIQPFGKICIKEHDYEDTNGFAELEVHVECDRLSQSGEESERTENNPTIKISQQKMTRKDKRQMYLNMVDGVFNPEGPIKCKICKRILSKWACFISHARLHIGFNLMCEFCGKGFRTSTELKRHCRSYHGMKRELACQYCNYLALDKPQLIVHERRVHTGSRPFECAECGAAYHSRRCLLQHLETHRTRATVQCPQCPALLKSRRHLARHTYSTHRSKNKTKST